jgi:peptide/nickel transport system substrate-binding protein
MKRPALMLSAAAMALGVILLGAAACGSSGSSSSSTGGGQSSVAHQNGGTVKVALAGNIDYLDPALAYYQPTWQIEYSTCLKLLNYPDKAGTAGTQLVPDAATGMPVASADGKSYTFTVKSGFMFSPPSNQAVTATTFKDVMLRVLNKQMASPAVSFMGDLVGASDYAAGKANTISGVTVSGNQITFKLTQPDPGFLAKIAMPFFCATPTNTPIDPKGVHTVPSAGPYYIASYTPNQTIVVKKNPNYHGSRPAYASEFDYSQLRINPNNATLEVKNGTLDYSPDGLAPAQVRVLYSEFGPGSTAATSTGQRLFVNPCLCVRYMALNVTRSAFSNAKVRQAVNYAISRPGILQPMGYKAGTPNDKLLPPGVPGAQFEKSVYPLTGPDVAKAKSLIQASGVKTPIDATLYTCNQQPCPDRTSVMQANLKAIGINVTIKQFDRGIQFQKEGTKGEPFDIADEGWIADYPDPFDWVNVLLNGENIPNTNGVNFAYLNDPSLNSQMDAAAKLNGNNRYQTYGNLSTNIMQNTAPWAAWDVDNNIDFFSSRIGCTVYQPIYGMALNTMCIKK